MGIVILFLIYVCLDMKGKALGARIKALEQQQEDIQKRYSYELWRWQKMRSPSNIEYVLSRNNIAMIWPSEFSIVRLRQLDTPVESIQEFAGEVTQLAQSQRTVLND